MKTTALLVTALFFSGCTFSINKNSSTEPTASASPVASASAKEGAKPAESSPTPAPKKADTPKPAETEKSAGARNEFETRCGWFVNPTPANAWLNDKDGEWTVSAQGGYQADGDWPEFGDGQWIEVNGSYGYGCACMDVTVDEEEMRFVKIKSAKPRPLSACRNDKALEEPRE